MDVSDRRMQVQLTQEAKIASDFHFIRAIFAVVGFVSALRRTAPARGPPAVCTLYRPIRTETQQTRPLLVGRVCVDLEPKALADGTAVSLWGGGGSGRRRRRS